MQTIIHRSLKDTLYFRDIPVLKYNIEFPFFHSSCSQEAAKTINEHYALLAMEQEHFCRTVLYPQAAKNAQYIQGSTPPFGTYEFSLSYEVPLNLRCITSLFFEQYTFMGGAHGSTIRTSDTWDFSTGRTMKLKDFFPSGPDSIHKLEQWLKQQAGEHLETDPGSFFDNYESLISKHFREENYYLMPGGLVIYFQEYDLAPYPAGRPEFFLPFRSGWNLQHTSRF